MRLVYNCLDAVRYVRSRVSQYEFVLYAMFVDIFIGNTWRLLAERLRALVRLLPQSRGI